MKYFLLVLLISSTTVLAWDAVTQAKITRQLEAEATLQEIENDRIFTQDQARTNYSIRRVNDLYTAEYFHRRRMEQAIEGEQFDRRYEKDVNSIGLKTPEQILGVK